MQPTKLSIRKLFKFTESEDGQILNQKYINLQAQFERVKNTDEKFEPKEKELMDMIEKLFHKPKTWDHINTIELYLVDLLDELQIETLLDLRLIDSKERLSEEAFTYYSNRVPQADPKTRVVLLSNLIQDLQFSFDYEDLIRDYTRLLRVRTNLFFVLSLIAFFMVDQLGFIAEALNIVKGGRSDAIVTAMTSGWIGASLSILTGLKKKIGSSTASDLLVIHRIEYIFSRMLIGMISGLILYYFFHSGILSGDMFPAFHNPPLLYHLGDETKCDDLNCHLLKREVILDYVNNSKLIVWCFVSGFSERLIPDILANSAKKVKG